MNNKKIVVYFSYTNHTKMIAHRIKEKLNCDILEIKTKVPYSNNYQEVVDDEHNSEASNYLPEIMDIDIDFSQYDEIILGTPVWWYRAVPAIRTFLTKIDLTGKKIYPFATNAGWLGRTFKEIEMMCLKAIVEKGLSIRFTEDYQENKLVTSDVEIDEWINSL